jgi:hypothetical protein
MVWAFCAASCFSANGGFWVLLSAVVGGGLLHRRWSAAPAVQVGLSGLLQYGRGVLASHLVLVLSADELRFLFSGLGGTWRLRVGPTSVGTSGTGPQARRKGTPHDRGRRCRPVLGAVRDAAERFPGARLGDGARGVPMVELRRSDVAIGEVACRAC